MKTLFFTLLLSAPVLLNAQYSKPARIFGKGQVDIQAAVGLFPTYMADRPEAVMPPLQLGLRWMAGRHFSVGIFGSYSTSTSREKVLFDNIRGRWDNTTYFLGLENGFHYTSIDNWDLYGGLCLLYQHALVNSDNPEFEKAMAHAGILHSSGKMALTAFVGSRFALSAHTNVFMELGYGVSLLKVGVGYKL
ncbi:MAG: hypothetical protein KDD19_29320 [Phaeodactylibacter sp.]|nr:hypothetical protein [Phaeodactylibacter sp.]MCB9052496.1 hypothetical protein [Lewinellaceae bacterium]